MLQSKDTLVRQATGNIIAEGATAGLTEELFQWEDTTDPGQGERKVCYTCLPGLKPRMQER